MAIKLTEGAVKAAAAPVKGRRLVFDEHRDAPRGFGLKITAPGKSGIPGKVFVLRYKAAGSDRLMAIGEWPTWSVEAARAQAKEYRRQIDRGTDVLEERKQARKAEAVDSVDNLTNVAERFLQRHAAHLVSGKEIRRALETDVLPKLGKRDITTIRRKDIIDLIEGKAQTAPRAAANVLKYIKQVFAFAEDREIIDANPIATLRPTKIDGSMRPSARARVLDDDELKLFWSAVETCGMHRLTALALKLVLVTGQRPGEVAGMRWSEIDGKVWTVPGERRKTGVPHAVPLTKTAEALLKDVRAELDRLSERRKWEAGDDVFTARRSGALSVWALSKAKKRFESVLGIKDKGEPWTPHDLRRTCRTRLAECGVSDEVAEKVIGHAKKGIVGVYNLHQYDVEKRTALEAWERRLLAIVTGKPTDAEVVPIQRARA